MKLPPITKVILANVVVTLLFFSIVIPGIIFDKNNTFQAVDQNKYHLPQVEIFVKTPLKWGSTYPSPTATTPGHHLVLSWVSKHFANGQVGRKIFPIRVANALLSLGLLLTLWWLTYLGGTKNAIESTYLVLPLLFSYQFLGGAIWVMTDNGALLWVGLALLFLMPTSFKRQKFTLPLAGILAAFAIAWRQTHAWLLIPLFLSVFTSAHHRQRWWLYPATLLPSLLVLSYFLFLWHGLTPPEYQNHYATGFNLAVPTYVISLFGIFGVFHIGYLSKELQKIKTHEISSLIGISLIVGLGIAILFPSSYDRHAGRSGGWLWEIARHFPSISDRSLLFLLLVPLGTILIGLWFKVNHHNTDSNLILISMIAWIAAHTANFQVYQRYYEGLLLITLAFLASRHTDYFRRNYLGPLILAGLMGAISLQQIVFD